MDTSKVTSMDNMFEGATAMTYVTPQEAQEAAVSNFFFWTVADQNQK